MEKLRVGIVFGGKSAEHEVSLQSAKNIVDAIDKSRFDVVLLGIDKQGQWHVSDASNYLLNADDPAHIALRPSATSLAQVPGKHEHQLIDAQNGQPLPTVDVIFPIVHGTLGPESSWGIAETCPIRVFAGVPRSVPAAASTCIHLLLCVVCVPVNCRRSVSYTHLDVYKRQRMGCS